MAVVFVLAMVRKVGKEKQRFSKWGYGVKLRKTQKNPTHAKNSKNRETRKC